MSVNSSRSAARPITLAAIAALGVGIMLFLGSAASAELTIGEPAPDLTATDSKGDPIHLKEYRGKTVVLEWTNADCPYTRKHYTSGNMQSVQGLAQQQGIVWLTVVSSAAEATALTSAFDLSAVVDMRCAVACIELAES